MSNIDLLEVLSQIDPACLNYQEWLEVGMALKHEGFPAESWDEWSRRDGARYHPGECRKKWNGFTGSGQPVTGGTLVQLAMEQGWQPPRRESEDRALDWDSTIGRGGPEAVVVDTRWLEGKDVPPPPRVFDGQEQVRQLSTYLETLFEASETVGYVTESWEKDGRFLPSKGCYDRTAGELIEQLGKCGGDLGSVLGDYRPEAGAWIRFNPLDGNGVKDDNVTDYRYALVESDERDVSEQYAILHELELPIAILVHSGKKSLHAIVKVDAANKAEYRSRVDYLYSVCEKNGLQLDTQNRNPSRLSRMPGVIRNGRPQYIVDRNMGKGSWDEWHEWIEAVNDDLPDPESMESVWDHLPELAPPLIEGVLRQGHKMLLAGPSKAGKSFALIELCIAIAEGREWFGWRCTRGRVLYVNLELDRPSCLHRFQDVYTALEWPPEHLANIDIWNLRGKALPMDKLAPKLIRRACKRGYIAVVIDPIYKVITGDENSADQMANFCNQFDKICAELSCATIYCHHHSKGLQGAKKSMDRASGSGVFARDPDAMLDMIELEMTDALKKQQADRAYCDAAAAVLDRLPIAARWREQIGPDDALVPANLHGWAKTNLPGSVVRCLTDAAEAASRRAQSRTGWRVEGTLREFARFEPVNLWFDYPLHRLDDTGALSDVDAEGVTEAQPWKSRGKRPTRKQQQESRADSRRKTLEMAYESILFGGADKVTVGDLMAETGLTKNTVRSYIDGHPDFHRDEKGVVTRAKSVPVSGNGEEAGGVKFRGQM